MIPLPKAKCYNLPDMEAVISVKKIAKNYSLPKAAGVLEAVKSVSFDVLRGEIFGILGPNGAGKTTTLEIIEGIKKQTSGKVDILGLDNLRDVDEVKKRIGIQLQSSEYLHHLTLGELLDLFASLYSKPSRTRAEARVRDMPSRQPEKQISPFGRNGKTELLQLVGLEEKLHAEFKDLSGGQKQRFTIATSLVHEPEILFLDEPTTGLDPAARRQMWKLIKDINTRGITIILTTHYMEEAEFLCHRVAIMDEGKILEIDEPRKLIEKISDGIQASFFAQQEISPEIFKGAQGVENIHAAYPKTIIELKSLDDVPQIVKILREKNIKFSGFTLKTATLEDVYLKLTGKEEYLGD